MLDPAARDALRAELRLAGTPGQSATIALTSIERLYREGKPSDVLLCAKTLQEIAPALIETGHREIRTFLARSVSVEPILPFLQLEVALDGFVLRVEIGGYGSFMDEMLNGAGPLNSSSGYDLVMLTLDLEDIAGRLPDLCANGRGGEAVAAEIADCLNRLRSMLQALRGRVRSRILVQGFVVPDRTALGDTGESNLPSGLRAAVRKLNAELAELCASVSDCLFFSVDDAASRFGKGSWFDPRLFLSSRVPMAAAAFPVYAQALTRSLRVLFRPMRKVLCTDLDQTLWGGILGEDGPEGVATGTAFPGNCYRAYQQYLLRLRARGVLLAIVSKNNPGDVEEAFTLRKNDLALKLDDFTARKIGWGDKGMALQEIARDLSLGVDSFVFVDDNPTECEAVRQALPGVAVVQVPADEPWKFAAMMEDGGYFDTLAISDDDLRRAEEYRNESEREALRQDLGDRDGFLGSLEIVCTFLPATEAPLARSVQLLGKTNQFNLTTRRHGAADVEHFQSVSGGQSLALRVRDRFGDSGVVGLLLAETQGEVCRIDTLLLSCRVIGRDIEQAMLAEAAQCAQQNGARWLLGEFRPTKKNSPCADFYPTRGFGTDIPKGLTAPSSEDETSVWYWYDLALGMPPFPAFLRMEHTEGVMNEPALAGVSA